MRFPLRRAPPLSEQKSRLPDYAYQIPPTRILETVVTRDAYIRWLDRKARAPVKRDKNRGNITAQLSEYKIAIHEAVLRSESKDFYTGELLDWHLIGQYDNVKSKEV